MDAVKAKTQDGDVWLSNGLIGQDDRLDQLFNLFEQLQLATVEASHPGIDLLTFAGKAYFFAVVLKKRSPPPPPLPPPPVAEAAVPTSQPVQVKFSKKQQKKRDRQQTKEPDSNLQPDYPLTRATAKADPEPNSNLWADYPLAPATVDPWTVTVPEPYPHTPLDEAIGLVYLTPLNVLPEDPLHLQELNIGIILEPAHEGKGYARQVIGMVLRKAFQEAQCHRVQAILPDHVAKDRAICLFTQMGFDHEGTRRRAFFSPLENVYKDVTYMGMLDTDWALHLRDVIYVKGTRRPAPKSVWDELFVRHQREREELLNWESGVSMRRSVTLVRAQTPMQSDFRAVGEDGEEEDMEGEAHSSLETGANKGKAKERAVRELDSSSESYESDAFPPSSESESEAGSVRSVSPEGYFSAASSSSSAWDMVDPSDSDSSESSEMSFDYVADVTM